MLSSSVGFTTSGHTAGVASAVTSRYDALLDCTDRDRLFTEYNRHVQESSKAVQHLGDQVGMGHDEYLPLLDRVNEARAITQRARDAYVKHIANHDC
jgi:hypothetical protein